MKFTEFNFKNYINETLEAIKFVSPTPVQEKLIPVVLSGRDLVGESKQVQERHILSYSLFSNN